MNTDQTVHRLTRTATINFPQTQYTCRTFPLCMNDDCITEVRLVDLLTDVHTTETHLDMLSSIAVTHNLVSSQFHYLVGIKFECIIVYVSFYLWKEKWFQWKTTTTTAPPPPPTTTTTKLHLQYKFPQCRLLNEHSLQIYGPLNIHCNYTGMYPIE